MCTLHNVVWRITLLILLSLMVVLVTVATRIHFLASPYTTVTPSDLYEHNIRDIFYNINGSNGDRDVFVVPRRAYYCEWTHVDLKNTILIVAEVHNDAADSIVACELNSLFSTSVHVVKDYYLANWVKGHMPKSTTHRVLLVHCLGFPDNVITNGSITKLIYKKEGEDIYSRVKTERLLAIENTSVPSRGRGTIVVCTTTFHHPEKFNDWLKYQKTLGIDLVHINADASFQQNAYMYPFLKESLDNGFAQMDVWNDIVGERLFYHGQIMKYQDCLYRYKGIFEYGIFYDIDDFFNPMLPDHKDMQYYFDMFFSSVNVACTCFYWRQMHCRPLAELHNTLTDGNLTKILSGQRSSWQHELKCAYRLDLVEVVSIHKPDRLSAGYQQTAAWTQAYVAHNRGAAEYLC